MKNIFIILITFMAINLSYGQDYVFRVMLNKGNNSYGTGDNWEKLKTGTKLLGEHSLKLEAGSYVGLVHASGGTLEVKEAGEYTITSLDQKFANAQSTLTQKYANYIVSNINEDGHNRLGVTGSATRGLENVDVFLWPVSNYYGEEILIDWKEEPNAESYVLYVKDKFDDIIYTYEASHPPYKIDFSDEKLANEVLVQIYIEVKGHESSLQNGYGIKPLKSDLKSEIKSDYEELKSELGEESSLSNLVLAAYFEEQNLLPNAVTHYLKAIEISPDVEDYQILYNDFLLRQNLVNDSQE